jgi:hypothetical protein
MSKKKISLIVLLVAFLAFVAAVVKADKLELPGK